jgi:hypothetical protein
MNLTGISQHKIKSINVEVNMLKKWIDQKDCLKQVIFRLFTIASISTLTGLALLPFSVKYYNNASLQYQNSLKSYKTTNSIYNDFKERSHEGDIINQQNTLSKNCKSYFNRLIGEFVVLSEAADGGVIFNSLKVQANDGLIDFSLIALANNSSVAGDFCQRVSKGKSIKKSSLVSTKSDTSLTSSGVMFEYARKVEVSQ